MKKFDNKPNVRRLDWMELMQEKENILSDTQYWSKDGGIAIMSRRSEMLD